jgi:hypothetical protein
MYEYSKPSLIRMSDNPDRNMKNEQFCSQLSTCFKRNTGYRKAEESLCAERDRTSLYPLHCLAWCSVSLLNLSREDVMAYIA